MWQFALDHYIKWLIFHTRYPVKSEVFAVYIVECETRDIDYILYSMQGFAGIPWFFLITVRLFKLRSDCESFVRIKIINSFETDNGRKGYQKLGLGCKVYRLETPGLQITVRTINNMVIYGLDSITLYR